MTINFGADTLAGASPIVEVVDDGVVLVLVAGGIGGWRLIAAARAADPGAPVASSGAGA